MLVGSEAPSSLPARNTRNNSLGLIPTVSKFHIIPVGLLLVLTGACSEAGADATLGTEDVPEIAESSADWNPQGQVICDEDFTRFTTWASFMSGAGCITNKSRLDGFGRNNVNVEVSTLGLGSTGDGLWYRFRADPTRCGDQIVGQSKIPLPAGTKEVWLEWDATFSANFDTTNPNCPNGPTADYKYVLIWTSGSTTQWRTDFKMGHGGDRIHSSTIGYSQYDDVPVNPGTPVNGVPTFPPNTVRAPGARTLFDGQPHHYRIAYRMLGSSQYEVYAEIDGQVTHNYITNSISDAGLYFDHIMLGSNRNVGATEDLFIWWRNMKVWAR